MSLLYVIVGSSLGGKITFTSMDGPLSVATAFGVRELDPALTFGGSSVERRTIVERLHASHLSSTLGAHSREKKSGVKPPHSKASRHSHAVGVVAQATSPAAVLTGDSPDCAALRRNVGRVARQDSCRRVACATTHHRSHLANA